MLNELRAVAQDVEVFAHLVAFFTSWGDGLFPVVADLGEDAQLLRLRIDLGSDETVERLRQLGLA